MALQNNQQSLFIYPEYIIRLTNLFFISIILFQSLKFVKPIGVSNGFPYKLSLGNCCSLKKINYFICGLLCFWMIIQSEITDTILSVGGVMLHSCSTIPVLVKDRKHSLQLFSVYNMLGKNAKSGF